MKTLYCFLSVLFVGLTLAQSVHADGFCLGIAKKSSKYILKQKAIPSSSKCPSGFVQIANPTPTPFVIPLIGSSNIADSAVTTDKIAGSAVTTEKISDSAVTAGKIAGNAITNFHVANQGIDVTKLYSGTATSGSILSSDGSGALSFSSNLSSFATLSGDQTFTGDVNFPYIDILSTNGSSATSPLGRLNKDNVPVAWARVTASGGLDSAFNIDSCTRVSTGYYKLTMKVSTSSGFSLIPVVTPEIDPDGSGNPPTGAANIRIPAINLVAAGNTFDVYMYNGSGTLADNDFGVMVLGR